MNLEWKNKNLYNADVNKVYQEISLLSSMNRNKISSIDMIRFAERNTRSELHKCFNWDNSELNNDMIMQARKIVNNIIVKEKHLNASALLMSHA